MKHTPGPWRISDARSTKVVLIDDAKGQAVGELVWADVRNPADARLIAAAPDLLEALQEVVRVFDDNPSSIADTVWVTGGSPETLYDHCRAAIAKAEGA